MRVPRIYSRQALHTGATISLEEDAAHHLARVLRVKSGRAIQVFNGDGRQFDATVAKVDRGDVDIDVGAESAAAPESPLTIELGIAIPANDRMDWLLQKATELGVHAVTPLVTERSQSAAKRAVKRSSHWQRVAINACEQCGRAVVPVINDVLKLPDWAAQPFGGDQWVMSPAAAGSPPTSDMSNSIRLLVGPEGGLSETEIAMATAAGFSGWQLGPRILRSETAPLAALAVLQHLAGDF